MPTEEDARVSRIASLALANAMIFQEALAANNPRVKCLQKALQESDFASALVSEWKHIIDDIDYIPIFKVAYEILSSVTSGPSLDSSLRELAHIALRITLRRAALRHDLMGRIYHLLLSDAKYFGAFYTMVPSATLLLKLSMQPGQWDVNWADVKEVGKLRVADLACGTGTLLKAALEAIVDNYVMSCSERSEPVALPDLYKALVEDVLMGYDVLPFAVHLAATTLALHSPDVPFKKMQLYSLPLGATSPSNVRLGSIDMFLDRKLRIQKDLFGGSVGPERVTAEGDVSESLSLSDLDLCVMNPPFTRSVGGNLLFGASPKKERELMQKELKAILKRRNLKANITAGLGSVFVALGDLKLRKGGYLSLVLPRGLLSGIAWEKTRKLLSSRYDVRFIIVSHEPDCWNFSENTDLSETLVVARKKRGRDQASETTFVNLWRRPRNNIEALTCADLIQSAKPSHLEDDVGISNLAVNGTKFGESIAAPIDEWNKACAFSQTDLNRTAHYLAKGKIYTPGARPSCSIPLARLSEIAVVGPDRRDVYDAFQTVSYPTSYSSLWGYDSEAMQTIELQTNGYLSPLSEGRKGRHLRKVSDVWPLASRLMITERVWLKTYRTLAARVERPSLSNVWWSVKLRDEEREVDVEKILTLWLNSTLGIILFLSLKSDTRGAWVQMKKPTLEAMPMLDTRALDSSQIDRLASFYDSIKDKPLLPFSKANTDTVRQSIDVSLSKTLDLPDLYVLAEQLAREPIVTLKTIA